MRKKSMILNLFRLQLEFKDFGDKIKKNFKWKKWKCEEEGSNEDKKLIDNYKMKTKLYQESI